MKTILSFVVSLVICLLFFLFIDWGLMKTQGLDLFPKKKVEEKAH